MKNTKDYESGMKNHLPPASDIVHGVSCQYRIYKFQYDSDKSVGSENKTECKG